VQPLPSTTPSNGKPHEISLGKDNPVVNGKAAVNAPFLLKSHDEARNSNLSDRSSSNSRASLKEKVQKQKKLK
jgi:hypothetical protein